MAKKDACYHKVKARYDVWPSAYASGALVKCRKVGAANWGNKSKKENEQLKKENEIIREGNDYIGVFQQDLKDKFQKLSNDMTANIKAAVPVVKKYNHNILFMKSVLALIRFNT